jgi:3-hydroxyacyl-[acyl-carrier-protein] dehydratase
MIDDQVVVQGRFTLTRYNLRERDPELHVLDTIMVENLRDLYATLLKGSIGSKAVVRSVAAMGAGGANPG